jgi:hypothetical protein
MKLLELELTYIESIPQRIEIQRYKDLRSQR